MIDCIKAILFSPNVPVPPDDKVPAAAAALLIEAAVLDGSFDTSEREAIAELLSQRFELSADEVRNLIEESEQAVAESVELYGFTRILKDNLDHEKRLQLIEMLWQVVYADGSIHEYEANLVRRTAGLLYVSDKDVGLARKKVIEHLDIGSNAA